MYISFVRYLFLFVKLLIYNILGTMVETYLSIEYLFLNMQTLYHDRILILIINLQVLIRYIIGFFFFSCKYNIYNKGFYSDIFPKCNIYMVYMQTINSSFKMLGLFHSSWARTC